MASCFSTQQLRERGFVLGADGHTWTHVGADKSNLRGVEHRNAAPALPKEAIGEVGQRPKVRRKQASGVPMKSKSTRGSDAPPQKLRKPSAMEAKFERLWQEINGPALTPEFKFHPSRRWRFDFACERAKIAVELDGGVWGGGRHTRGAGFIGDCEKGNAACALGWRVWHLATGMVTRETLMQIRAAIAWHDEGL